MDEASGFTEDKVSKYNSGIAQIFRLDELWQDTHKHSRAGRLNNWNWTLDRVWCELAGDLKDNDDRINQFKTINESISSLNNLKDKEKLGDNQYNNMLYSKLIEKEIFLRKLQNDLGKGSAYQEEADDWE